MALPIGKISILIGAGVLGSVLAKEERASDVTGIVSGAFKLVMRQIRRDDSTTTVKKPRNDALVAQVNSLRQELQMLASNSPITIVTTSGSGSRKYGMVVVIVVIGYGYIWWKGWKLPDMMFATRRSLADARESIAKQLESVYSSIAAAKRHFSQKLDGMDRTLDEVKSITEVTNNEVLTLRERTDVVSNNVKSFHDAVQEMESKIRRIEGKQDLTNEGLRRLCTFAWNLENSKTTEKIQASPSSSSRSALELPPVTPSSRTGSLPSATISAEPPSPSESNAAGMVRQPLRTTVSASGLREFNEMPDMGESSGNAGTPNGVYVSEDRRYGSSGSGLFGWVSRPSFITRTYAVANSFNKSSNTDKNKPQQQ